METSFDARSSYSGYVVFGVMWIPIALLFVVVAISRHQFEVLWVAAIPFSIWIGFTIWLSGFRIIIENGRFRYRDGFYRWYVRNLSDITSCKNTWVKWKVGTRIIKIPRLVVRVAHQDDILVNTKPFTRPALKQLAEMMHAVTERG